MKEEPEESSPPAERPAPSVPGVLIHPVLRVLLFIAVGFLLLLVVNSVAPGAAPGMPRETRSPLWYVLATSGLLLESWLFLRAFHGRSYRALGIWFYPGWGRELAAGAAIGAGLLIAVVAALAATRAVIYRGPAGDAHALPGLLLLGGWMLLAAAFEEILFRGYVFQRLVDGAGPVAAVAIFSMLFAAAHLGNPSMTALSTANTFLSGVLLSVAYLKTRALWLPIGLHWAWNFTMGPLFSLPVSGLSLQPTLLRFDSTGAKWLSGGAYGPEGGVALSVACVVATLWLVRTRRVSPSPAMAEALE
jgi:membrane protease YdiL (CAAX protease family)